MNGIETPVLDAGSLVAVGLYLAALIAFGVIGRLARKENSMQDFFLGGRGLGFLVLMLTLYATQYSGNTFVGFSASAYRTGFQFLVGVVLMMGIIGTYVIYAPKLFELSHKRQYITFSDFIYDRFGSRSLATLISLSGIIALANFLVTNLKAMGEIVYRMSGGEIGYGEGIVILAAIIIVYESLGGLRSVAWTDTLQGIILFVGCVVIFVAIVSGLGGWGEAVSDLKRARPDFWLPPSAAQCVAWGSTALMVALGLAMYPQAIQRIYAARSAVVLRRCLQVMVFMPLFTTLPMVLIGILGNISFPGLDRLGSEGITVMMITEIAVERPEIKWLVALFVTGVLAAIMSTADSALLSIASSVTQDLARPATGIQDQRTLTLLGKLCSWVVMGLAVWLACILPQSIWKLVLIKTELLAQTAPAMLLGIHWRALGSKATLWGFLMGTVFTLFFLLGNYFSPESIPSRLWGSLHAGVAGLGLNMLTIVVVQWRERRRGRG